MLQGECVSVDVAGGMCQRGYCRVNVSAWMLQGECVSVDVEG